MKARLSGRPLLVWILLGLYLFLTLTGAYGCFQILMLYLRPRPHVAVEGGFVAFATLAVSIASWIGLWRSKRWAWILAVLLAAYGFLEEQRFLLSCPAIAVHNVRFVTFGVLEIIQFGLLLSRPVREFFLSDGGVRRAQALTTVSAGGRSMRVAAYFLVATAAPILISAYTMALLGGRKLGGTSGFLLFLLFGFTTGTVASLIFAIALTYAVRALNLARAWQWILVGGALAPLLMVLALLGTAFAQRGSVDLFQLPNYTGLAQYIFWGPAMLNSMRFVAPIAGVFTAWICSAIYPWSFPHSSPAKHMQ